jgi:excisionase family DNA binding protein
MHENNSRRVAGGSFALTKRQAADELSISIDTFERHVMGDLRLVRIGRKVLVPVREIEGWLERNSAFTIEPS